MGRRIVQLVSLVLAAGLTVPLALALAQTPQPTPASAPAPPGDEPPPQTPVEDLGPPAAAGEKALLQNAIAGDAPEGKSSAPVLPGPKWLTLPTARPAKTPAKPTAGVPSKDPMAIQVQGQGEMPAPPAREPAPTPTGSAKPDNEPAIPPVSPSAVADEPASLPISPADSRALPAAETLASPATESAARDAQIEQSQAPGGERSPLPPALDRGGKPAPAPAAGGTIADPDGLEAFVLPPDQLPLGRQTVGLTVDVVSPEFLNLNQEASLKLVVKNTGSTDAKGVVVRDELPQGLQFQSSQPIAQQATGSQLLIWRLGTVAAHSERLILLRVTPKKVGAFEHAATVTMQAGAKARTLVREPKLKVEQIVSSAKVLKGQPVEWRIAVTNTGNGPAHRVVVQAKLSPGLRHESGEPNQDNLFEQELDLLEPGQRVTLDPLVTDAVLGGAQTCTVLAASPDVTTGLDEARNTQTVNVVEPKLTMTVAGPDKRFTFTTAKYDITVVNPGTATARRVQVLANLPVNARLQALPPNAQFDKSTRKLAWNLTQLDPGEKAMFSFQVKMGGPGPYQVAVDGRADSGLHVEGIKNTIVEGYADLDMEVTANSRVVDVGDQTLFKVRIVNRGTKEATRLLLRGFVSKNLEPKAVEIENNGDARVQNGEVVFPQIDRLGPNKETVLYVQVLALPNPGLATFRVELMHDDLPDKSKIEAMGNFRITPARSFEK